MTDIRADETGVEDEDRLPWLEAVDETDDDNGPSPLKLIAAVLIGLVAIGLVVGGIFWLGNSDEGAGGPDVIAAPEGDYKVKPEEPGGMKVEGEGDTAFAASTGETPKGKLNVEALPEAPVTEAPQRTPTPSTKSVKASEAAPAAPAKAATGPTIQLGAFSTQSAANSAWKALSGRFKYLAPLSHSVIPVTVNGRTLYRLRASGPDAGELCGRLRVAGESCVTV